MEELSTETRLDRLDAVIDFVDERLGDCPEPVRSEIALVVNEIFSNIVRYAYNPENGEATVRITVGDDITIEFEDSGVAYDPLSNDDPDISLSAEEREIGGLGIFMVKKLMDSVEFRREGNKNILTIKKRL